MSARAEDGCMFVGSSGGNHWRSVSAVDSEPRTLNSALLKVSEFMI